MKSLAVEDPENLFPRARDAVVYLTGLGGFWGGVTASLIAADTKLPAFVISVLMVGAVVCAFSLMNTVCRLESRMTGRSLRPWPLGHPSFRTQVIATLPSTVMAAAQRMKWNAVAVTVAIYGLLIIGLIALVAWPTTS